MKYTVVLLLAVVLFCSSVAFAVDLESFSFGVHFIPSVERTADTRRIDVSFSFGGTLRLDSANSIVLLALLDTKPTNLGTSAQFDHWVTDHLRTGPGVTVLWRFSEDSRLEWPIVSLYAHAEGRTYFYPELWGETGISFPLLTLAEGVEGWDLLPLSELPTLYGAMDVRITKGASIQTRVTFQPVITDTRVLENPIWRITDKLLVLPMSSVFLRYVQE